jgi:hypothetical protein
VKAWKYLVLLAGIAGIAGFFFPFLTFQSPNGELEGSVSAYQIVRGIDAVDELIDTTKPMTITSAEATRVVTTLNAELERYRFALIACYVPAAALALLGALVGARRKMGRIAGLLAIVIGLANAAVWLLFYQVSMEQPEVTAAMGFGLHLLLVAGVAGVLAGVGALLVPDRGYAAE